MKLTKQRLKEIIKEELAEAVLDYDKTTGKYGRGRSSKRKLPPLDPEIERRERERQNQDYIHRYGKKPFGSRGTHLEEDGAKPLSGTRVKRKSDGMMGYRTVGKKKDRAWSIKWNDGTYERNVPRSEFESVKDKE